MQNHYNLLYREEEREMLPLCARPGRSARSSGARWRAAASRATGTSGRTALRATSSRHALRRNEDSDHAIIDAVGQVAQSRGVSLAQVALAWLRRNPVVVAPLVGASKTAQIDDAVASLEIELTEDEVATLEAPYTPRYDFQGISDDAELARISARLGIKPANPARTAEPIGRQSR